VKLTGDRKLIMKLSQLPAIQRDYLRKTIQRNTEEGARVARALAPLGTGETKADIFTQYALDGMRASVEAAQPTKEAQIRAKAIEFGRKNGLRGTTAPQPYIRPTQEYLGKRFGRSIRRAIKKAAKEAMSG
jgi:hypothetical protein